jgi:hypothetical protein
MSRTSRGSLCKKNDCICVFERLSHLWDSGALLGSLDFIPEVSPGLTSIFPFCLVSGCDSGREKEPETEGNVRSAGRSDERAHRSLKAYRVPAGFVERVTSKVDVL